MNRSLTGAWLLCLASLSLAQGQPPLPSIALDAQQQAALGIRTTAVVPAGQQQWLASATVTVPPGQEVTVAAPFAGVIARLDAGLGDSVRSGAPLALLSSPALADARRQLREAELEARNAQAALQRDQAMHDEGIIPAARLQITRHRQQAAEAGWQAQLSALKSAGLNPGNDYASGQIVAPRAGQVVDVQTSVGQRVEAGAVLMRIADLRQLQLDIVLSGEKATQLRAGDAVRIPSHEAKATLLGVSHSLNASQQARARARVTSPGRLQPGQVLQVQLQPATDSKVAAWQVPARALLQWQGRTWVLVASAQGYAPTPVEILSSNDDTAIVQGPLHAQQRVASTGLSALRPLLQKAD
ncbi:MAG: efflux RND transporter periplasmic adaptor subunit [Limnohabitans sp.]